MNTSFKTHIYWQFFVLSLFTAVLLFALLTVLYAEIERVLIESRMNDEQRHYLVEDGNAPEIRRTETTVSAFVPSNTAPFHDLPALFQGLPIPFSDEIEIADKEYWIMIRQLPSGVVYVAMDTAPIEEREGTFQGWLIAVSLVFVGMSSILARFSTHRILKPLSELTEEISRIDPRQRNTRISEQYHDRELNAIAATFNRYLSTMEDHAAREKMLISMASHELRTPIAIASGALDVLDERRTLSVADKKTVERIRSAATVMNDNVEGILMLARRQPSKNRATRTLLGALLQSVIQELINAESKNKKRLSVMPGKINHAVVGDPSLISMLLRNLIQNALQHTQGIVTLRQNKRGLQITDEGTGLPEKARLQLGLKTPDLPEYGPQYVNESGLGLFIVTLISERLAWKIEIDDQAGMGTCLHLCFPEKDA